MRRRRRIREDSRRPSDEPKQRPHFYKIIIRASLESGELMIPMQFTMEYLKKIADVAVLKDPTGRKWQVQVKKVDGSVRFQNGWRGFLEYHSISVGHFLLFRYDGNSTFTVFVFNRGASEIDYPSNTDDDLEESNLHTKCLIPVKEEPEEEDYVEPLGVSPQLLPLPSTTKEVLDKAQELQISKRRQGRKRSTRKQRRNCKHQELRELGDGSELNRVKENEMEVIEVPSDNPNIKTSMSISTETSSPGMSNDAQHGNSDADNSLPSAPSTREVESNCLMIDCKSKEFSANAGEHLDVRMPSSQGYKKVMAARKKMATDQQREKAINTARTFKTENPSVMIIMKPSYVYKGILNLTFSFAKKFLTNGLHSIELSISDGRTWMVRCSVNGRKAMITGGWRKFVQDNKLEEGDCCVFELSEVKGMRLKITIFRVVEEAEPV